MFALTVETKTRKKNKLARFYRPGTGKEENAFSKSF
jgi:hypothetical protein